MCSRHAYKRIFSLLIHGDSTSLVSVAALVGAYKHSHKGSRACVLPAGSAYLLLPLSYALIFVSYIRGTGERQIFLRYLRIVLLVLVMALLAIGEQRHCLPDADIGSVRCAPCVLICLLKKLPPVALCLLYTVIRIRAVIYTLLRESELTELQILGLGVYICVDPEIAHIRVVTQTRITNDLCGSLSLLFSVTNFYVRPSVVIKGFPCLALYYGSLVVTCIP